MCPVAALEEDYVTGAKAMSIDLSGHGKLLFPPWRGLAEGGINVPLSSKRLTTDLQFWLRRCGVFTGETAHGLRTGSSIELSLSGKGLADVIMRQACWASKGMATYYMKESCARRWPARRCPSWRRPY